MGRLIKKVKIDQSMCIGAGTCVVLDPNGFALNAENKAVYIDPENPGVTYVEYEFAQPVDNFDLEQAAEGCPVMCIFLYDEQGEQVFP